MIPVNSCISYAYNVVIFVVVISCSLYICNSCFGLRFLKDNRNFQLNVWTLYSSQQLCWAPVAVLRDREKHKKKHNGYILVSSNVCHHFIICVFMVLNCSWIIPFFFKFNSIILVFINFCVFLFSHSLLLVSFILFSFLDAAGGWDKRSEALADECPTEQYCLSFSPNDLCTHYFTDHNYYAFIHGLFGKKYKKKTLMEKVLVVPTILVNVDTIYKSC